MLCQSNKHHFHVGTRAQPDNFLCILYRKKVTPSYFPIFVACHNKMPLKIMIIFAYHNKQRNASNYQLVERLSTLFAVQYLSDYFLKSKFSCDSVHLGILDSILKYINTGHEFFQSPFLSLKFIIKLINNFKLNLVQFLLLK